MGVNRGSGSGDASYILLPVSPVAKQKDKEIHLLHNLYTQRTRYVSLPTLPAVGDASGGLTSVSILRLGLLILLAGGISTVQKARWRGIAQRSSIKAEIQYQAGSGK